MPTVLVTGAGRGIGLALAEALIARGDRVIATVRDPFRLPETLKSAPKERIAVVGMEVTDDRSVARAAASVDEPIDALVNNAGIHGARGATALDADLAEMAQVLAVNTIAPLRVARAFLPHLKRSERPRIMTVSSQMGALSGSAQGSLAYRTSKAAVNKAMQGLAVDLRPQGVTVVVVHPGWVRTDMGGGGASLSPAESANGLLALLDRLGMAETGRFFRWDGTEHPW
jgi:NAD(P)-dependent dehydrogenase (short-subunit alcohol dehydrogenase family)